MNKCKPKHAEFVSFLTKVIPASLLAVWGGAFLSGCSTGPELKSPNQFANPEYPETQLFYLDTLRPETNRLQHYYRLLSVAEAIDPSLSIPDRSPVTVIANGVRLPQIWRGRFYAVAVVHVKVIGSPNETDPLIVGTFPNAQPGQLLPFRSLRVFGEDTWNPETPWEFRLQVVDLRDKQNETVANAIDQVNAAVERVKKVPSWQDPVVQLAIEGAKALLKQPNRSVADFRVSMYSLPQVGASANTLPLLRRGSWLIANKRRNTGPDFWEQSFFMNERSKTIYAGSFPDQLTLVDLPYMEISSVHSQLSREDRELQTMLCPW